MPLVDVGEHKLYAEVHGAGDGPPLLLIMGLGGSCRGWLPLQVPEFSQSRKTIIFDNRGVGRSDDPAGAFTTADLAEDTRGLLDALEIPQADVLGASLGGMVAQELALAHPERVDRLILVGTYARPDAKRRLLLETWRDLVKLNLPVELQVNLRLLWGVADQTLEQTDLIQSMVEFFKRDGAPTTDDLFVRQCEACLAHDAKDRLIALPHRALVICGQNDQLTPPKMHRELAEAIPDSQRVTLPNGGHIVEAESAERFNQAVLQFLDDGRP